MIIGLVPMAENEILNCENWRDQRSAKPTQPADDKDCKQKLNDINKTENESDFRVSKQTWLPRVKPVKLNLEPVKSLNNLKR